MTSRNIIEWRGRSAAGIIEEVDRYYWIRVLDAFEMYVLDTDQSVTPCLVRDGYWESWITAWVTGNVDEDTLFIDVGANTGYYSFWANYLGATVMAFEPNPEYLTMIKATIKRNHTKGVHTFPYALSDYTGEAVLNIPGDLHGSASLNAIEGYETSPIEVDVNPLDDFVWGVDADKKTVLKIDAEGEEERILRGAKEFIERVEDLTVLLEYTPDAYSDTFLDDLYARWDVSIVTHDGGESRVEQGWITSQTDWAMLVLRSRD